VKTNRLLLVMTFMSAILFGTNLYAQQEVDPTWYDPWGGPAANNVTSHPAQQHIAGHKNQPKMVSASPEPQIAKRFVSGASQSQFAAGPEVTAVQALQSLTRNVPSIFIIEPDTLMVYPISLDAEWDAGSSPQLFCRVMAMACTQRRPEATREAPAVIFLGSSLTEAPSFHQSVCDT
jgi:hypothetical protein